MVPRTGLEPAFFLQSYHLKIVRLPISPPGQIESSEGLKLMDWGQICRGFSLSGVSYRLRQTSNNAVFAVRHEDRPADDLGQPRPDLL